VHNGLFHVNSVHAVQVNVCSATTHLHCLLREQHEGQRSSTPGPLARRTAPTAAAEAEIATARHFMPALVQATLQAGPCLTPDHCVRMLTAHAWMQQWLPHPGGPHQVTHSSTRPLKHERAHSQGASSRLWRAMLSLLCSKLASPSSATPPENLSRGLWACARLGHVHAGLASAASARILELVQERHGSQQVSFSAAPLRQGTGQGSTEAKQAFNGGSSSRSRKEDGARSISSSSSSSSSNSKSEEGTGQQGPPFLPSPQLCTASTSTPAWTSPSLPSSLHPASSASHSSVESPSRPSMHSSPPSLPDTLSNLVWALGQLLQPVPLSSTPPLPLFPSLEHTHNNRVLSGEYICWSWCSMSGK
jgi:hypothetical protein